MFLKWILYLPDVVRSILIETDHHDIIYRNSCNANWLEGHKIDVVDRKYISESKFQIWSKLKKDFWSY